MSISINLQFTSSVYRPKWT